MLIRMTHPKHGATHVYSETDAVTHETWGWVREVPEAAKPKEEAEPEPSSFQATGVGPLVNLPKNAFDEVKRKYTRKAK